MSTIDLDQQREEAKKLQMEAAKNNPDIDRQIQEILDSGNYDSSMCTEAELRETLTNLSYLDTLSNKGVLDNLAMGEKLMAMRENEEHKRLGLSFKDMMKFNLNCQESTGHKCIVLVEVKEYYNIDTMHYVGYTDSNGEKVPPMRKQNLHKLSQVLKKRIKDGDPVMDAEVDEFIDRAKSMNDYNNFKDEIDFKLLGKDPEKDPFEQEGLAGNNYRLVLVSDDESTPDPSDDDRFDLVGKKNVTFFKSKESGDVIINIKGKN